MTAYVRKCPGCNDERPETENFCGNLICTSWDLTQEPLRLPGQVDLKTGPATISAAQEFCPMGHPLDFGDVICFTCESTLPTEQSCEEPIADVEMIIDGWTVLEQIDSGSINFESYIVERSDQRGRLTLYHPGFSPDASIYEILFRLPKDHAPEFVAYGQWRGRHYEIVDDTSSSNLLSMMSETSDAEKIREIMKSIGRVLGSLAQNGMRHGNLRPENILISNRDPLQVLLTGFQYARLSSFDLDTLTQLASSRYTAPEMIAGGISIASDWWSLGMVVLQLLTNGRCFDGINEKAFCIHVVTRGVAIPKGIDPSLNLLLRGLLSRDPDLRWQWPQVKSWLAGEIVDAPDLIHEEIASGPVLEFKDHSFVCPKAYALAAADSANWEEAKDLLMRGVVTTWLEDRNADPQMIAGIRLAVNSDTISEDLRHALALMWMNPNLPLIYRGDIVASAWLLNNASHGYELVTGPLIGHLRQMNRETSLCEISDRIIKARELAKHYEIELDEEKFKIFALASSRQNLERQWIVQRRLYPGAVHVGLNSLMDRKKITNEELLVLLGASIHQFEPAEQILAHAKELAFEAGLHTFDTAEAQKWFEHSRNEIYRELEKRTESFSQCGVALIDEWANDFRNRTKISLPKVLALLSVSKETWAKLSDQQYVSALLEFYKKRIACLSQRGPLGRMLVNRNNSRVDLAALEGVKPNGSAFVQHLINRVSSTPLVLNRVALEKNPDLEKKLRRLKNLSKSYKKDTGVDSLYLGFPFLVSQEGTNTKQSTPRIAPILLWPIKIEPESRDKVSVYFHSDQKEVLLNPALTGIIGEDEAKKWANAAKDLLGRSSLHATDVMDAFGVLAEAKGRILEPLPSSDFRINAGTKQIVCSAVIFHAEFTGQAIGEDLREIQKKSTVGTALERTLRVTKGSAELLPQIHVPENDRYFTTESDPSQIKAVFRARQSPGLLIEGPPGTGKSQTIVNIIADCIGRKESVLVVCQKSAALKVLAKRLNAEGLQDRFFYITDIKSDRKFVLQNIQRQINSLLDSPNVSRQGNIKRKRNELANKIESLEKEIDKHHKAIHEIDETTGISYRGILSELIEIEEVKNCCIDVPTLRGLLGNLNHNQLNDIEQRCAPLARMWLESSFEGSPFAGLNRFSSDKAVVDEFTRSLFALINLENKRDDVIRQTIPFDVDNPSHHQQWVEKNDKLLKTVDWNQISAWQHLFNPDGSCNGSEILNQLEELKLSLNSLNLKNHDSRLSPKLIEFPSSKVRRAVSLAKNALLQKSFLTKLNPLYYIKSFFTRKLFNELGETLLFERLVHLQNAAELELSQRPTRKTIILYWESLYGEQKAESYLFLKELRHLVDVMINDMTLAQNGIHALKECPLQNEVELIVKNGLSGYLSLISKYSEAFTRHHAREASLNALKRISTFFSDDLIHECERNITENQSNLSLLQPLVESLPSLPSYQMFRVHATDLSDEILKIFAKLREKEKELKNIPPEQLSGIVRRLILRETRLAWKDRIEQKFPILRLSHQELSSKIQSLDELAVNMQRQNGKFLASNIDIKKDSLDHIIRLMVPKNRALRELIEGGWDAGLNMLRAVWLMTPETASQLLPLRAGMFDVIIFDEASQIHIENALPTLYRAKRVVISGDEKQMPPANFFIKRLDGDGDPDSDDENLDDEETDFERKMREEERDRREIHDCSDLLALGKMVLPEPAMLQIHYRSKYRELIAYSNAAFYENRLSIPVRHPESVIHNFRPIEMIHVEGVYDAQTNRTEAARIVELLGEKWMSAERPSIGVVTFNMKQAELIEDLLAERAENDPDFRQALAQEQDREQDGEDMGFFVKNVENVQGDERDVIIFSSTFGKDKNGDFRRSFGPLGQGGGERRLNVAVTRAREKIILVTSLPINEISDALSKRHSPKISRDYLQAYFDYASKVSDCSLDVAQKSLERLSSKLSHSQADIESKADGFVQSVENYIRSLGLIPSTIKDSDAFGLDFVIEDQKNKRFGIGIECDAHRHQLLENARAREVWRPKVLSMGLPYVHRVSSYAWYHQRESEQQNLKQAIEEALNA